MRRSRAPPGGARDGLAYPLNWARAVGLTSKAPNVDKYLDRLADRPASALREHNEALRKILAGR